jgi:hypothetical protein
MLGGEGGCPLRRMYIRRSQLIGDSQLDLVRTRTTSGWARNEARKSSSSPARSAMYWMISHACFRHFSASAASPRISSKSPSVARICQRKMRSSFSSATVFASSRISLPLPRSRPTPDAPATQPQLFRQIAKEAGLAVTLHTFFKAPESALGASQGQLQIGIGDRDPDDVMRPYIIRAAQAKARSRIASPSFKFPQAIFTRATLLRKADWNIGINRSCCAYIWSAKCSARSISPAAR